MTLADRGWTRGLLFSAGLFGICAGYFCSLAMLFFGHHWILTSAGKPVPCDFLAFWAAGEAVRSAHGASAYDPGAFHAVQTTIAGPFPGAFYWNYPPLFFFVAVLLASTPYLSAFIAWIVATVSVYAFAIGGIVRRWEGALAACASPVLLLTAYGGQNGFLTAALLGGVLTFLVERPIFSGVLLGLLTYKPQLGILVPLALTAGGHWRALSSAAVTAAVAAGAAALVFGPAMYGAFFHSLPVVTHAYLILGGEGWTKMQSAYAIVRSLGGTDSSAWFVQGIVIAVSAVVTIWLWRSELSYDLKAAGLALATMLSTPYMHIYDFPILLVALGFLYRHEPFDWVEWGGAIVANLLLLVFLAQIIQVGPVIVVLVGALIIRRAVRLRGIVMPELLPAVS